MERASDPAETLPPVVECSNCGAGPEAWAAVILAALSFLIAVAALIYAKRAMSMRLDEAEMAVGLAREETRMAREEHDVFLREVQARALFEFSLRVYTLGRGRHLVAVKDRRDEGAEPGVRRDRDAA